MGFQRRPEKPVLFVGTLFSRLDVYEGALPVLKANFGSILYASPFLPWDHSDYYAGELGAPICRSFVFFETVIDPAFLVEAKLISHDIEKTFSLDGRRQINIDPGYVTLAKVVLSSKKNYSHRIYLGKGVYGELELFYKDGRFNPLPYTYYDYRDDTVLPIFLKARDLLKGILKAGEDKRLSA